jgi:predicted nucleic acid-binding protein
VRELVLDASVVLKWFRAEGEAHAAQARVARAAFEAGELLVLVPPLLRLEILNVAGRRWQLDERSLLEVATALDDIGFELAEPSLAAVARWTARGLTAYDAAYVAVAEGAGVRLLTDDRLVLSTATGIATALGSWPSETA